MTWTFNIFNQQLCCISFWNVFVAFIRWLIILAHVCPMLAPAVATEQFLLKRISYIYACDRAHATFSHNDGWKCKLIISPILLTMWYDNNILKPTHDTHTSHSSAINPIGWGGGCLLNEWKQRWWITSDWHTKIITHFFLLSNHSLV